MRWWVVDTCNHKFLKSCSSSNIKTILIIDVFVSKINIVVTRHSSTFCVQWESEWRCNLLIISWHAHWIFCDKFFIRVVFSELDVVSSQILAVILYVFVQIAVHVEQPVQEEIGGRQFSREKLASFHVLIQRHERLYRKSLKLSVQPMFTSR